MKTHILKAVSIAAALILFVSISNLKAQTFNQVVRGTVVDRDTKSSIPGANIVIANSNPFVGTTKEIEYGTQLGLMPNIMYRIHF